MSIAERLRAALQTAWGDRTPTTRCDWIDQLRGWAVLVMIEVHVVNTWLGPAPLVPPPRLNFLNGLVAPSFLLCAGFSLVLSTFAPDGRLRPFGSHTLRRLGFILLCAYLLHAPGLTLVDWTLLGTDRKYRGLFQIDVLQCVVYSLLILHGLARLLRTPLRLGIASLSLALAVLAVSSRAWASGLALHIPLPLSGMVSGLAIPPGPDGVASLFPLLPWLAFPAVGTALGTWYFHARIALSAAAKTVQSAPSDGKPPAAQARQSEVTFLLILIACTVPAILWGRSVADTWLAQRGYPTDLLGALHNTSLPSFAERAGWVCLLGAILGLLSRVGLRSQIMATLSSESLLVYLFHLFFIYAVLRAGPIERALGIEPLSQGPLPTIVLCVAVMSISVAVGMFWAKVRKDPPRADRLRGLFARILLAYFLLGGWTAVYKYWRFPEKAQKPYYMLKWLRASPAPSTPTTPTTSLAPTPATTTPTPTPAIAPTTPSTSSTQ